MATNARAIIEAMARRGERISDSRKGQFVNCGLNHEKVPFQVLFHEGYAEVGLAFDEAEAATNRRMVRPYAEHLKQEIRDGKVNRRSPSSNEYLVEQVATAGMTPEEAADAILLRLAWWRQRFQDRPEPDVEL